MIQEGPSARALLERGSVGRVGIVYPRPTFDSVPSLCAAVELLARNGFAVDVFAEVARADEPPVFERMEVTFYSLGLEKPLIASRTAGGIRGLIGRGRRTLAVARAAAHGRARRAREAALAATIRANHSARRYTCMMGVDPDGLVLASALAAGTGAPLGYISLELLLSQEALSSQQQEMKQSERELCKRIAFAIVQDEDRARLFAADNHLEWDRVVLVPNAPLGPARRRRSPALRERLGLSRQRRIALHAGSLGDWTGIDEIIGSVRQWPDGWVLLVHTRYDAEDSAYADWLKRQAPADRVFFSLKPLPRQAFEELVDGADAGIAFYVPGRDSAFTGQNVRTMGLSSGKLAQYTRAGLPVVVNSASSIGDLVAASGCGIAVDSAKELPAAFLNLEADESRFSQRAISFFDTRLDFARSFQGVLDRLTALSLTV